MNIVLRILLSLLFIFGIAGCKKDQAADSNTLKVGVIAGPESQLMEKAKEIAAKRYGLNIEIVQFSDYTLPNEALASGSIDANMFQHLPYLESAIKAKGYQITPIAKTFIYPMAVYSKKIKEISDLKDKATVAIQNDPSNEARALLLLEKGNLITLKPDAGFNATINDIVSNPKKLDFKEIDAAQIPRVLPDVDIGTINTNYAMLANLSPTKDGLIVEDGHSPYANLVVVRTADKNDPRFLKLIAALHSAEVLAEAQKIFKGQAIPAWK